MTPPQEPETVSAASESIGKETTSVTGVETEESDDETYQEVRSAFIIIVCQMAYSEHVFLVAALDLTLEHYLFKVKNMIRVLKGCLDVSLFFLL